MKNTPKQYILWGIKSAPSDWLYIADVVTNTLDYSDITWVLFKKKDIEVGEYSTYIHGIEYKPRHIIRLTVYNRHSNKTLWSDYNDKFYQKLVQKGGAKERA